MQEAMYFNCPIVAMYYQFLVASFCNLSYILLESIRKPQSPITEIRTFPALSLSMCII